MDFDTIEINLESSLLDVLVGGSIKVEIKLSQSNLAKAGTEHENIQVYSYNMMIFFTFFSFVHSFSIQGRKVCLDINANSYVFFTYNINMVIMKGYRR